MRRAALFLLALMLSQPARAEPTIEGEWLSLSGQLTFVRLGQGDYEGKYVSKGWLRLRGILEGDTFEGHWTGPSAPKACEVARDGSLYWGRVRFTFDAEFTRFDGNWTYCDETRWSGDWVGKRPVAASASASEPLPSHAIAALEEARETLTGRCGGSDRYTLAVHGGAVYGGGNHDRQLAFIKQLLELGRRHLADGAGALDVVHGAIRAMEDSGLFNAGRGAIANKAGVIELDASIMEGGLRKAGAVAAVRGVKNAISAARLVMERTKHVLMVGPEADAFVSSAGGESVDQAYFLNAGFDLGDVPLPEDLEITPPGSDLPPGLAAFSGRWAGSWDGVLNAVFAVERLTPSLADVIYAHGTNPNWSLNFGSWIRLPAEVRDGELHFRFTNGWKEHFTVGLTDDGRLRIRYDNKTTGSSGETILQPSPVTPPDDDHGTVGAVALDRCGDLAAGTSTGGFGSKTPGRVGDSPIVGAGTYADNETAAVSGLFSLTTAARPVAS